MGENITAAGFLGGSNGKYIGKLLEKEGITNRFTAIEGQTRICINITNVSNQNCTEILEPGPLIMEKEVEEFLLDYEELVQEISVMTISGSLPKGVPTDLYARLIQRANHFEIPVLLDTSGPSLMNNLTSNPYIIKPNIDEVNTIFPMEEAHLDNYIQAIKYMKKMGVKIPMISLGKKGAIAGLSDGIYKVNIPKVQAVNTVGSGDSFIAGCAVAIERGYSEIDMLRLGSACGTANTQFQRTGYVEAECVKKFFEEIGIVKIA